MAERENPSDFYYACRNGEIEIVHRRIAELSLLELDRMEVNGSTALHAACFFDHRDIIRLLLERGFTRRVTNKFNNTPENECQSDEARQLFLRPKNSNRFGGLTSFDEENVIWIVVQGDEQNCNLYQTTDTYDGNRLVHGLFHGDAIIQQLTRKMVKIDVIQRLFRRAIDEKDCRRLIQAYTTNTEFSTHVNNYLISLQRTTPNPNSNASHSLFEYVDTICANQPLYKKYGFKSKCYRAIKVKSMNDLKIYQKDAKLINRTFLSTTKNRQLAQDCISDRQVDSEYTAIISFEIRYDYAALDVSSMSEFPREEEVLIVINRIFKVIQITSNNNNFDFEIELKESKPMKNRCVK